MIGQYKPYLKIRFANSKPSGYEQERYFNRICQTVKLMIILQLSYFILMVD
jgi:hypothetical protein